MRATALRLHGAGRAAVSKVTLSPSPGEMIVEVERAGVCGSDLHVYRTGEFVPAFPVTPGHEVVGRVVVPSGDFAIGDRVVLDSRVPCGLCQTCVSGAVHRCPTLGFLGEVSNGGFATHVAIRPAAAWGISQQIDADVAVLAEPTAVVLHARARASVHAAQIDTVTVLGAGPIGVLQALVFDSITDVVLVESNDIRRALAATLTRRQTVASVEQLRPADVVFDCAGFGGSLSAALGAAKPGGVVIAVALHHDREAIDANALVASEAVLVGSHVFADEMPQALDLLAAEPERFRGLVTDTLPLNELAGAIDAAAYGRYSGLKIVVDPGSGYE